MPQQTLPRISETLGTSILSSGLAHRELQEFLYSRIPQPALPDRASDWSATRDRLRSTFLDRVVFRGVPPAWRRTPPVPEWTETIARPGYVIRKLRYQAVPGLWIPALLYEPAEEHEPKSPAVLNVNAGAATDSPHSRTAKSPAVLNVNGHVGVPGKAADYEQMRSVRLARSGVISLHPEWLACGELSGRQYAHNRLAHLDLCGVSGLSVFFLALQRGLEVLLSHRRVDRKRIAMTGLSGGGWQTILLSALDPRISAAAPNAGYIGFSARVEHRSDVGDLEQVPTDLLRSGDYTHLTAMLAPRPTLLIYNEKDECCFPTARARASVFEPIRPYFQLYGRASRFEIHNNVDPGTHNYERDNRERFCSFLASTLGVEEHSTDPEARLREEVLPREALQVGVPGDNAGFGRLAVGLLSRLPERRWPGESRERSWAPRARKELREVLRLSEGNAPAARLAGESGMDQGRLLRYRVQDHWTLPAVEIRPRDARGTALVVSAQGKARSASQVHPLLSEGRRVVSVDLTLTGECNPAGWPKWQNAALMGATGERLLGLQVGQILSILGRLTLETGGRDLSLVGVGPGSALACACACALLPEAVPPLASLRLDGLPPTLKLLIEEDWWYEEFPEMFCFGLLRRHDVREILALCRTDVLTLGLKPEHQDRARTELGPLLAARHWQLRA